MKQSHKATKPVIEEMMNFDKFIKKPFKGQRFIAHCYLESDISKSTEKPFLGEIVNSEEDTQVLVGPEGDFSIDEGRKSVTNRNCRPCCRTPYVFSKKIMKKLSKELFTHIILPFVALAIVVVGIYYCFFAPKSYEDCIPDEAKAVVQIETQKAQEIVSSLAEYWGIQASGINLTKPLYAFITTNEYIGFIAQVKN